LFSDEEVLTISIGKHEAILILAFDERLVLLLHRDARPDEWHVLLVFVMKGVYEIWQLIETFVIIGEYPVVF